jgi:hypothetical protein
MSELKIDLGKQPRSVMRVLHEFDLRTKEAVRAHGRLGLYQDGLPIIVGVIHDLYPKMRRNRRIELSGQVFKIVENMLRITRETPPTQVRQ